MEKVLIISYFFLPCNLTASQRANSWAKDLKKIGFEPIIITRNWEIPISNPQDSLKDAGKSVIHEKNNDYEVYYLPYKSSLRDRIYIKYGNDRFVFLRKMLSFMEIIFQNLFIQIVPYRNIYYFSKDFLIRNKDIKKVIISGNPFILFHFGYLLKKHCNIKWIADYRDAWTTSEINSINKGILFKLSTTIEKYFERKWVNSASEITASSKPIANVISKFVGVKETVLHNGIDFDDFLIVKNRTPFAQFTISYIGTLYTGQKIEMFCSAYKNFIAQNPNINCQLLFPGISFYKEQKDRINLLLKGYEKYFTCMERMNREKILEIEVRSNILFHVAWQGYSGIIASKIYEYIASGSFILVTPSDNGSIEEILKASGCGISTNNETEIITILNQKYQLFLQNISDKNNIENENVKQFSRANQTKKLANIIEGIKV